MIQWIDTNGPPLCGTVEIIRHWNGIHGTSVGSKRSDYERACAVSDYVGEIACGAGTALVLGDEPLRSAFHFVNQALIIARWWSCESVEKAEMALLDLPVELPKLEDAVPFELNGTTLLLFDAANLGTECGDHRSAAVSPGTYHVTSERYESPGVFRFVIHRFLRK